MLKDVIAFVVDEFDKWNVEVLDLTDDGFNVYCDLHLKNASNNDFDLAFSFDRYISEGELIRLKKEIKTSALVMDTLKWRHDMDLGPLGS